ncbi:MAG: hypothetical protein LBU65_10845 [Planctomycetaceae bacterium]|jgi:hypothetical protein|nr:hypothetical protein [Planctomycetaceae bacterium]
MTKNIITLIALLIFSFETALLSAAERYVPSGFQERLERDWLLQDAGTDMDLAFIRESNTDAVKILEKVLTEHFDGDKSIRERLNDLHTRNVSGNAPVWRELYFDACKLRRIERLKIVREKTPEIVYAKHQVLGGSHYAYTEAPSDAQHPERRDMLGGKILLLKIQSDGTVKEDVLVEAPDGGTLRDPNVSYDGKRVVFSMRKHLTDDDYHLYDYDTDTKQIRQLTFGHGFADVEPCYLPDGNILFCSTRCMQIVDCWWTDVTNLYVCDSDGRFLRRLSFDQVHTNYPQVLDDGRVVYTRWDYNDRGQIFPQPLFMMNYDGTGQTEYYGNNSWFPTTILHARGIPGTNKVVAVASGHHTHQRGKLIVIDRMKGTQENQGVQLVAPIRDTKADKIDAYGQDGDQFQYPLALDETNFIVAYTPDGFPQSRNYDIPFGLYYLDINNTKRELLAFDPKVSCGQPMPLQSRSKPMLRATPIDYNKSTGLFYVQDVYFGPGLTGIERGTVKELRVVALEFRAAGIMQNGSGGPGGGALSSTPISIDNASWDVKRVLGTVPVEADGSAYFEVPSQTPVYFQLLDGRGNVVQTMRSWSTLQPGETFACVGCHEPKGTTKGSTLSQGDTLQTIALKKPPQKPSPMRGVASNEGFSYIKVIQPVLDTRCVQCHFGGEKSDGTNAAFSLLGNQYKPNITTTKQNDGKIVSTADFNMAGRQFSESYVNLTQRGKPNDFVNWLNVQSVPTMLPPYYAGAIKSKLLTMFDDGQRDEYHKDIRLSDNDRRKLALWIDLLVPFCGSYTEANTWNNAQKTDYAYYEMKRLRMAEIERENVVKFVHWKNGETELPTPESFRQFEFGGIAFKRKFVNEQAEASKSLKIVGQKTGSENIYRNIALTPTSVIETSLLPRITYPHASTNSEYAGMECFAAKNVIDGQTANKGHGEKFPSWGPNKRTDLYITIDFGRPVEIDKAVCWLRADFQHDTIWNSAELQFSDGSSVDCKFEKTADPQTIQFPKRTVTSITFKNLKQDNPPGWAGFTEVEVWGKDVE